MRSYHLAKIAALLVALLCTTAAGAAELVMFEEPGCIWCRRWHAEIGPGYPQSHEGRIAPLRRHDIRDGVPPGVKLDKPVTMTPTFVLVEEGAEVGRILGYPGQSFFYPLLDQMLQKLTPSPPAPAPAREREASAAAPIVLR